MMIFLTGKKEKIEVRENDTREGGQAVVYFPLSRPDSVVKVYKKRPAKDEIEKLTYMIARPPEDPCRVDDPQRAGGHISFAWPSELVYDSAMNVAGYLMPRIQKSATLLDVFNPHRRRILQLQVNWRFLHGVAANFASVIAALHERGYVIGDVNEGNVLVNNRALVTLIDVDSFQVDIGQKVFPCPVGKEEYTPREVLAQGFHTRREACSDDFGLAVLIYQLLMEGNHPFRGIWKGTGEPLPIAEKIRMGYFPFADSSPNRPFAALRPAFGDLMPEIQQFFLQAFIDGHRDPHLRPSAALWHKALRSALNAIRLCPANPSHYYFSNSPDCPWCNRKSPAPPLQRNRSQARVTPVPSPAKTPAPVPASTPPVAQAVSPSTTPAPHPAQAAKPPPSTEPLRLSKTLLDFGQRFAGSGRGNWRKLTLRNTGARPLIVSLYSAEAWLSLSEDHFLLPAGQKKDIRVKLLTASLAAKIGEQNGTVLVRYDSGSRMQAVKVKAGILYPDLYFSTRTCGFITSLLYQKLTQDIRVKNLGKEALSLKFSPKELWVRVSPEKLKIEPGKTEVLRVVAVPSAVPAKRRPEPVSKIQIKGPGSYQNNIEVRLRMRK